MNETQMRLCGTEEFFQEPDAPPPWQPVRHRLEQIKSYLMGYEVKGRTIYFKVKYIAAKLGMGRRTVFRYFAWLRDAEGWLKTAQRKARYCIRQVVKDQPAGTPSGTPFDTGPITEAKPEVGRVLDGGESRDPAGLREARRQAPPILATFRTAYGKLKPFVEQKRAEAAAWYERNREALRKLNEPPELSDEDIAWIRAYHARN